MSIVGRFSVTLSLLNKGERLDGGKVVGQMADKKEAEGIFDGPREGLIMNGLRELTKERGVAFWFACAALAAFVTELIVLSLIS